VEPHAHWLLNVEALTDMCDRVRQLWGCAAVARHTGDRQTILRAPEVNPIAIQIFGGSGLQDKSTRRRGYLRTNDSRYDSIRVKSNVFLELEGCFRSIPYFRQTIELGNELSPSTAGKL
jgi:hypothetical protein